MPVFTDNVRRTVARIPAGKVLDYKTVACLAGSPNPQYAARAVSLAMGPPGKTCGWHRVVTVRGELSSPKPEKQRELLLKDRIEFRGNGNVDMDALWLGLCRR